MDLKDECDACGSPLPRASIAVAYDRRMDRAYGSQYRLLHILLVVGDCIFIGMQPILVYMSKVDGKFPFSPVSVNFLTEMCKIAFAVLMLLYQSGKQKPGEKSILSLPEMWKAARANYLLAVPACLYAVNNYLKFVMQLYFKPVTVKMLSNLKVLTIALLLKVIMGRKFTILQWEALCLLLIGITINQVPCGPDSSNPLPLSLDAYFFTFLSVSIPSTASVYNEYALKKQFDTSVHLQNLFMYCYGATMNLCFLVGIHLTQGGTFLNLFKGHSQATAFLIVNNACQGILSSFFFKYADTILKKYSSTVATIFTGLASAALFGHSLTINFALGVTIVIISMHQFFSNVAQPAKLEVNGTNQIQERGSRRNGKVLQRDFSLLNMAMGANEEANHLVKQSRDSERDLLLPR